MKKVLFALVVVVIVWMSPTFFFSFLSKDGSGMEWTFVHYDWNPLEAGTLTIVVLEMVFVGLALPEIPSFYVRFLAGCFSFATGTIIAFAVFNQLNFISSYGGALRAFIITTLLVSAVVTLAGLTLFSPHDKQSNGTDIVSRALSFLRAKSSEFKEFVKSHRPGFLEKRTLQESTVNA